MCKEPVQTLWATFHKDLKTILHSSKLRRNSSKMRFLTLPLSINSMLVNSLTVVPKVSLMPRIQLVIDSKECRTASFPLRWMASVIIVMQRNSMVKIWKCNRLALPSRPTKPHSMVVKNRRLDLRSRLLEA